VSKSPVTQSESAPVGSVRFTHLGALSVVSKTFKLGKDGRPEKKTSPMPCDGLFTVRSVRSLEELRDYLAKLTPKECLIWGTPIGLEDGAKVQLTTKRGVKRRGIPRDREHFEFREGQPAFLMLDYDPEEGKTALSIQDVYTRLLGLHPAFNTVKFLAKHSAGGGIYHGDTLLREPRGIRFYAIVSDGSLIPEIQKSLLSLAWVRGEGRWQISQSGRLLSRGLFDASVGQPERIDFCGGAHCIAPLQQRLEEAVILNPGGGMLDGKALLAGPELITLAKSAMDSARPEAMRLAGDARSNFENKLKQRLEKAGISKDRISAVVTGVHQEEVELLPEYPLTLEGGAQITVKDLLDQPHLYEGRRMHDPLEPDYHNDSRIAVAFLKGAEKRIFSHAHGGITYRLTRLKVSVQIQANSDLAIIRQVAGIMSDRQVLFRRGDSIVTVTRDGIVPLTAPALVAVLSEHVLPLKQNAKGEARPADFPTSTATAWIDLRGEGLPPLESVISTPTMLADGRIIQKVGYDQQSGLFLVGSDEVIDPIPESPSENEVRDALRLLWEPFAQFPLASENDRGVLLALILTAFTRPAYPTAPAGLITAPAAAHGKTLLAMALARLSAGEDATIAPPVIGNNSEEEIRKRLFAMSRAGKAAVVYDNLEPGALISPGLCAYLTSGTIEDRVLGASKTETVPFRSFFLITGNNVIPEGDLPRRTLLCRIDAGVENAFQGRTFNLNPDEHCLENRQRMARAALTVLQAYRRSNKPTFGTPFGSFESWDKMVRQPVLWVGQQGYFPHPLGDSIAASLAAATKGNVEEVLNVFLRWWEAYTGIEYQTSRGIAQALEITSENPEELSDPQSPASIRETLREEALEGLYDLRVAYKTNDGMPRVNTSKLGHFLKAHQGRVISGRRIQKCAADDRTGRSFWRVVIQ
jgi:hypothetical protein